MEAPKFWDGVLRRLRAECTAPTLDAWMGPIAVAGDRAQLRLLCPSPFHRDRVRERYLTAIRRALEAELGADIPLSLEVTNGAEQNGASVAIASPPDSAAHPAPVEKRAPAPRAARPVAEPVQQEFPYRFDNFVVGSCNAFAREAALALAHGRALKTLFLSAGHGMGKTHLARALLLEARRTGTDRVLYAPAESFTNEFMSSIRAQRMPSFKRRFREECSLLVLEDVQFLQGKKATQLELLHTLDHLVAVGARVVLTADRLPRDLPDLDPRLCSKLCGSVVAEIEPPDAQVRRTILRQRAAAGGIGLPDECLDRLVDAVRGSVRDLEGVLVQLVASATLLKRPIDRALTEDALRKLAPAHAAVHTLLEPEDVIGVVASFFKTTPAALAARSRRRDVLWPRQLAMYLCRRYTGASLQRIGEALGRDHPAVSHAIAAVERLILERAPLRYQVESLAARLDEQCGTGSTCRGAEQTRQARSARGERNASARTNFEGGGGRRSRAGLRTRPGAAGLEDGA